jgi:hypothetical protein
MSDSVEPKLTRALVEQMRSYFDDRDEVGWYYGNKEQFEKRHEIIRQWFEWQLSNLPARRRNRRNEGRGRVVDGRENRTDSIGPRPLKRIRTSRAHGRGPHVRQDGWADRQG